MSASSHAVAADSHGHGHGDHDVSKFQIYVQIAMLLAVITGVEITPFPKWILVTALVVLSAVKFLFVIFYFMHLRWDKPFCTILFFIGLVLAAGTMGGLMLIFGAEASVPLPT